MEDMTFEDGVFVNFYQAENLMVKIKTPTSNDLIERKATDNDIARFAQAYEAFDSGDENKKSSPKKKKSK